MQITRALVRAGSCALVSGVLLSTTGCLVMGSASQKRTGKYVSETTMEKISPGETTAGWVLATLGEPDQRSTLEDGSEVWRWNYTERRASNSTVFLLFAGSDEKEANGSVFVELRDGIVINKWRA